MSKEKYSFREMEHIAVNYAITCLNGYNGSFRDYMKGVKKDWRKWLKEEDKRKGVKKVVVEDTKKEPVVVSETTKEFYKDYVSNGCDCLQMWCPICHG